MPDPVAIVSVVSSATVAVAVPFIGARLERQRLRYQQSQERFAELRAQLDVAAEHLTEGVGTIVELISATNGLVTQDDLSHRITELAHTLFQDNTRLALRLGAESEVCLAHNQAMSGLHHAEARGAR
jgi:hypothetical protein